MYVYNTCMHTPLYTCIYKYTHIYEYMYINTHNIYMHITLILVTQ
jgi:hypothetical protein